MTRLDRYLIRESLPAAVLGALLYSFLGVVSATLPRLQWIVGAPFFSVLGWLALQLPTSLVQTLPLALVLGVLVSYGRLAADRELIAMQAGAVSLRRVNRVYVMLGIVFTLVSLGISEFVLPRTHAQIATWYWQLTSGSSGLFRLADRAVAIDDFTLHFASTDRETDRMQDVRIERWDGRQLLVLFADSAVFEERGIRLSGYSSAALDLAALELDHEDAAAAYSDLLRAHNRPSNPDATMLVTTSDSQDELVARFDQGGFEDPISISGAYRQSRNPDLTGSERRRMEILFQRKIAEPFGSLALLLLAMPLAVRYARSRSLAFGLSLVVTLFWYLLMTFGQLLAQTGSMPPWLGMWLANIVLAIAGFLMQQRPKGTPATTGA